MSIDCYICGRIHTERIIMEIGNYAVVDGYRDEQFRIFVHPSRRSNAVIVNCPGLNGSIDGFNAKYFKLGQYLSEQSIGAYVQMPNISGRPQYVDGLLTDVGAVCRWTVENAAKFCGATTTEPDIYLVGFSAGGAAVATIAYEFRRVKKILLMEPSLAVMPSAHMESRLGMFSGTVDIVIGDGGVGRNAGENFYRWASLARGRRIETIRNCDHQFRGRINGQYMSNAHLWAFGNLPELTPEGGLVLYE